VGGGTELYSATKTGTGDDQAWRTAAKCSLIFKKSLEIANF